ncbi:probable indole-3-pyruvate monooxygenase YUCCA10 [Musa acuminata AAA Group]|uniref:probable indole-3-pyruvate monooxygenase YUCCA10 n=1 Tax=Musa acuminata AAA Group TaxID=214697 RepID=UPI0031E314EE
MKTEVVIVGAGPSGLATAACLSVLSIPYVVLEREACSASLWKLRTYDRVKLHLAKRFCELPHMPIPRNAPTFVPKNQFIQYLDAYVERFNINPVYSTHVELASYDEASKTWRVMARNALTDQVEEYRSRFLVVASGENTEGFIPDLPGLQTFSGKILHSSSYKSGRPYTSKKVLVVGSGNSGMEIAYDLAEHEARTSIVINSPLHVVTKEMIHMAMVMLGYLPVSVVDALVVLLSKLKYGDLSTYGIVRPSLGPMRLKAVTGRSSVIDVGTIEKIKTGEIEVVKGVTNIRGNEVEFEDGKSYHFDAIVFATGFRTNPGKWLQDADSFIGEEGFPRQKFPNHWKGRNDLYFVGFGRSGLAGCSTDAQNAADDIARKRTTVSYSSQR